MKTFLKASMLTVAVMASIIGNAQAGGFVVVQDETLDEPSQMVNPNKEGWVLPVIVGGSLLCAILCGGNDKAAPPVVVCNNGC